MANVKQYLEQILKARFGKDVRQSIHDSIDAINTQVTESEAGIVEAATAAQTAAENANTSVVQANTALEQTRSVLTDTLAAQAAAEAAAINAEAINADLVQNVSAHDTAIADLTVAQSETASNVSNLDIKFNNTVSDAYYNDKTYVAGEYCIDNNQMWKCKVPCKGQRPSEGAYWTARKISDEIKQINVDLSAKVNSNGVTSILNNRFKTNFTIQDFQTSIDLPRYTGDGSNANLYIVAVSVFTTVSRACGIYFVKSIQDGAYPFIAPLYSEEIEYKIEDGKMVFYSIYGGVFGSILTLRS